MSVAGRKSPQTRESENRSDWFAARRRLADFARTLRDNGFKVVHAETRPSLAVLRDAFGLAALRRDFRCLLVGARYWAGAHTCRKCIGRPRTCPASQGCWTTCGDVGPSRSYPA